LFFSPKEAIIDLAPHGGGDQGVRYSLSGLRTSFLFYLLIDLTNTLTYNISLAQSSLLTADFQQSDIFVRHSNPCFMIFGVCGRPSSSWRHAYHLLLCHHNLLYTVTQKSRGFSKIFPLSRYEVVKVQIVDSYSISFSGSVVMSSMSGIIFRASSSLTPYFFATYSSPRIRPAATSARIS